MVFMRRPFSSSSILAAVKTYHAPGSRNFSRSSLIMASFKVHNTLRPGPPQPFIPIEKGKISWYACGPTVYDHSHLGHARNYVSTDIIRRILMHYFGYDVKFVMNITDIDDKIILKARRKRLLELEKSKLYTAPQLSHLASQAFQQYAQSNLPSLLENGEVLTPENYPQRRDAAYGSVLAGGTISGEGKPGDDEAKMKMHITNLTAAATAIQENEVFGGADEIILPYLDSLYKESVNSKDHAIWTDVTKYWEDQFMEDMDNLNVMKADVVTRVTEYVPKIADFVEKVIQKGFAYEAGGSVYFDIAAFEKAGNTYAHLKPESRNDQALLADGEGSLSKNLSGKRGTGDFALWKKSKPGEPSWPSPWGEGRPGWHIECSVMASDILGSLMDIHSGGIDLAFPHHDNELAQSEAYYCEHGHPYTWVNYFMHMGHLSIAGSKMSKSLKNFQTIKDALKTGYSARGMRIVFLMGRWNDGVEISPDMRTQAEGWETTVNNFFANVKSLVAEVGTPNGYSGNGVEKLSLSTNDSLESALEKAENELRNTLSDSFDTPKAMRVIYELIKDANIYMSTHKSDRDVRELEKAARWVTTIVGILGLDANATPPYNGLGWAVTSIDGSINIQEAIAPYSKTYRDVCAEVEKLQVHSQVLDSLMRFDADTEFGSLVSTGANDIETLSMPYLRTVSRMRDELRRLAPISPSKRQILSLSDSIRDEDFTNLGVYLDDRPDGQASLIKFVPKADLIAQREEKAAKEREKMALKEAMRLAREKQEEERKEKARVSPMDMYKGDARFSEWDEEGMPVKMKGGEEVPKSQLKKLKKDWERQKKLWEEYKM